MGNKTRAILRPASPTAALLPCPLPIRPRINTVHSYCSSFSSMSIGASYCCLKQETRSLQDPSIHLDVTLTCTRHSHVSSRVGTLWPEWWMHRSQPHSAKTVGKSVCEGATVMRPHNTNRWNLSHHIQFRNVHRFCSIPNAATGNTGPGLQERA